MNVMTWLSVRNAIEKWQENTKPTQSTSKGQGSIQQEDKVTRHADTWQMETIVVYYFHNFKKGNYYDYH